MKATGIQIAVVAVYFGIVGMVVICGYRADDSYFTYASDFVSGNIYKATLENALRKPPE